MYLVSSLAVFTLVFVIVMKILSGIHKMEIQGKKHNNLGQPRAKSSNKKVRNTGKFGHDSRNIKKKNKKHSSRENFYQQIADLGWNNVQDFDDFFTDTTEKDHTGAYVFVGESWDYDSWSQGLDTYLHWSKYKAQSARLLGLLDDPDIDPDQEKKYRSGSLPSMINPSHPARIGLYDFQAGYLTYTTNTDGETILVGNNHVIQELLRFSKDHTEHPTTWFGSSRALFENVKIEYATQTFQFNIDPKSVLFVKDIACIRAESSNANTNKYRYTAEPGTHLEFIYPDANVMARENSALGYVHSLHDTRQGYCGSPVIAKKTSMDHGAIYAFHHNKTQDEANAMIISREAIKKLKLRTLEDVKKVQGVIGDALLPLFPHVVGATNYHGKDGSNSEFAVVGTVEKPKMVFKSDYRSLPRDLRTTFPQMGFGPANMSYCNMPYIMHKYAGQKLFKSTAHWNNTFNGTFGTEGDMLARVFAVFSSEFGGIAAYLTEPQSYEEVCEMLLRNLNGVARGETSSGYGVSTKRNKLLEVHERSVRSSYDCNDYTQIVACTAQLKDEIRKRGKDTRGISVPQIHLLIQTLKWLGSIYKYFHKHRYSTSITFAPEPTSHYWTKAFSHFNPNKGVMNTDLSKQDSRFSHIFVWFITKFLKHMAPQSAHEAIDWIMTNGYTHKHFIDYNGDVITFPNGEPSGFPLTILMNSFYNFFLYACSHEVHVHRNKCDCELTMVTLGDDAVVQNCTNNLDDYREVCEFMNHKITGHTSSFANRDYLSLSFTTRFGMENIPYYNNVAKGYGSLRFYDGDMRNYAQKLCSFYTDTFFAPPGSLSRELNRKVLKTLHKLKDEYDIPFTNSFKSEQELKRYRLGIQSNSQACFELQGGLIELDMNNTKRTKQNKVTLVTDKTMQKFTKRLQDLEVKKHDLSLSPAERANAERFARNFCTAHEPMKLPSTLPKFTTAVAEGGTMDIINDARFTGWNYAMMDPLDPDKCFYSFERISLAATTTTMVCPNFHFSRNGDYSTQEYYVGIPIDFENSNYGRVRRPCTHVPVTSSTATIGSSGNHKGFAAYYSGLDLQAGTITWRYTGNIDPASSFRVLSGIPGAQTQVAIANLRSGAVNVPQVLGSNISFVINMPPNTCDSEIDFNFENIAFNFTANNAFVQRIRSIYDFSGSSSTETYADSAVSSRLVCASMFCQASATAFSTGQLKIGISQDRLELDMIPQEAFERMNTKKYFVSPMMNLNNGAFGTWLANEKLDYRFSKQPIKSNVIVMAWRNVVGGDDERAATQLTFELRAVREFVTTQQLIVPTLSKCGGSKLVVAYISYLVRCESYLLDNHTHMDKIKQTAKKFVTSPEFKSVMKSLGKTTVTALLAAI